jgi:uncharacterized protein
MSHIVDRLLESVRERAARAQPADIRIGSFWTCVAVTLDGRSQGGLASTLAGGHAGHHQGRMPVERAGRLLAASSSDLTSLLRSESLLESSVGLATVNALLEVDEDACVEVNAADVIADRGRGRNVAVVGHFPFIRGLRESTANLWVLELNPREGDLPAARAPEFLPRADVVALTGTSLLNGTFDALMADCRDDAFVIVLGATTPLSPVLFEAGVDAVAGTRVVDLPAVMRAVSQGATFRQIPGKRLLTMFTSRP